MIKRRLDLLLILFTFIISLIFTADLFINKGQPATFDGTTHITTIAQFYRGLSEGERRVTWGDGFANYGMPIPLISQQTTPYLGAYLNFLFNDVLFSYNFVYLLGTFLSAAFYYFFLRIYFKPIVAFTGTFLFNFAPYRIINLYIRGAQPEFFASVFIPLILIAIYLVIKKKNPYGTLLLIFSTALLILSHPFMLVIASVIFIPYITFCLIEEKRKIKYLLQVLFGIGVGIGITSFYTIPLFMEIKYFYYGLGEGDHFVPNQFLGLTNYLDPNWYYYYKNDTFVRGNFIKADLLETIITGFGLIMLIFALCKRKKENLLIFALGTSLLLIFLTLPLSEILYRNIKILNGIQHPWRMLNSYIFITPIIFCIILQKIKYQNAVVVIVIFLVAILRFPQLYGKNSTVYPQSYYFNNPENLHGNILNTVWTGKTSEYPVKNTKPEIISGEGNIKSQQVKNSTRQYEIQAKTDLRMADYTFYFPGWKVYVDGKETQIQFQDPNYRGVITYDVPKGNHVVNLKFENTKPRILGYALSLIFLIGSLFYFYLSFTPSPFRRGRG